jgi:inosose dehydratase
LEFDLAGEAAEYAQVLDEIHATGYAGTELGDWGFMPTDPAELKAALAARALALVGGFVPIAWSLPDRIEHGREQALRTARLMRDAGAANAFVVLADDNGSDPRRTARAGRIRPDEGWSAAQWKDVGASMDRVAREIADETGLRCVFHPHAAGFVETPSEVERLMECTQPDLVELVLDTGHCRFGGGDPVETLRTYADRIGLVHFKDWHPERAAESAANEEDYFAAVARGVFCLLGEGAVDFQGVVDALREHGYAGWITVEQDVLPGMGDPKACAAANRAFLKGFGL